MITDRKDTYPVHVCRSARKTIALEIREGVLYLRVPKMLQEPEDPAVFTETYPMDP